MRARKLKVSRGKYCYVQFLAVKMAGVSLTTVMLHRWKNVMKQLPKSPFVARQGRWCSSVGHGPLHGIRVLDLTRVLAGPFATMLLGDMGAEIIKIERPGSGDETRGWGPPFLGDESVYFLSVNRNKKSVCIDLKQPKGVGLVKELAQQSDVLVENFLPGKLKKFGLDYESLKHTCPRLIHCSITGFGQSGPYAHRAGYDVSVAAMGGLMNITGPEGGEPCRVGVAVTDISTGLFAHGAVMAALIERYRTGKGARIDCSLLASQTAVLSHIAGSYLNAGMLTKRLGTAHHSLVPYQAFSTKDGRLVIGVGNDAAFANFCKILDIPNLAKDERFATNRNRVENRTELIRMLSEKLVEHDTSYWEAKLSQTTIPFGPINSMKEVFEDPQVNHLGLVQTLKHPTVGEIHIPGPAVNYTSELPGIDHQAPPLLGQHTRDILASILERSEGDIDELISERVLFQNELQA